MLAAGSSVSLVWPDPSVFIRYMSQTPEGFRLDLKSILKPGGVGVGTSVYVGLGVEVGYGVGNIGVAVRAVTGVYVGIGIYVGIGV